MRLTNVDIKSTDSPLLQVNAEFVTIRDAYSVCRYFNNLVRRNVDVEILPKNTNCCKPITQPKIPVPEKIFRCGNATTVIWKDGTKTIVKLMPGADDSDYGAFTAALAKKIYGGNGKVMKYAGMVQRVKSKAEKKAERKAKHKAESEKQYIVSQFGQVYEYRGAEEESLGYGQKFFVRAKSEDEARGKAVGKFRKSPLKEWLVLGNGSVCEVVLLNAADSADGCFGIWTQSCIDKNYFKTCVFANDKEEAKKALTIIHAPDPIPF